MKIHYVIEALFIGCFTLGSAFAVSGQAGVFALRDGGARSTALADAQTAQPMVSSALMLNPAGLYQLRHWEGAYFGSEYSDFDAGYSGFGAWRKKEAKWVLAASLNHQGDEVFGQDELRLGGNYSLGNVHAGATWILRHAGAGSEGTDFVDSESGVNHRVEAEAWGLMGLDAGLIITPFGSRYALGVVFQNLISQVAWSSSNEARSTSGDYTQYLPVNMRYGFMANPDPFMGFHVDLEPTLYHDGQSRLATGLEFTPLELLPDFSAKTHIHDLLKIRFGYGRNIFTADAYHRLALGAGFKMKYREYEMNADLGYQFLLSLGSANALGISVSIAK